MSQMPGWNPYSSQLGQPFSYPSDYRQTDWNSLRKYTQPYTTVTRPVLAGETDYRPDPYGTPIYENNGGAGGSRWPATAKDAYMRGQPYYSNPKQEYLNRGTTQPVSVPPIYGVPSYSQPSGRSWTSFNRPMQTQYSQSPYGLQVARDRQIMNAMRRREQIARQRQMEAQRMYGEGGVSGAYIRPTANHLYGSIATPVAPTPVDRYRAGGYPAPGNREGGYGSIRPMVNSLRRAVRNYQRDNPVDPYEIPSPDSRMRELVSSEEYRRKLAAQQAGRLGNYAAGNTEMPGGGLRPLGISNTEYPRY